MLVLTRKLKESIRIGDAITVTVLRVKGNTVRLGIEAPREVRVVRGELAPLGEPVATAAQGDREGGDLELESELEEREEGAGWTAAVPAEAVVIW